MPDGHSLDAADGSPVDALYVDYAGRVGIGTTSPNANLDVPSGEVRLPGGGGGITHFNYLGNNWNYIRGNTKFDTGNVGIGIDPYANYELRVYSGDTSGGRIGVNAEHHSDEGGAGRFIAYQTQGTADTYGVYGRSHGQDGESFGVAGHHYWSGVGVGAWSWSGNLIEAYDGDYPGGSLRFYVDQNGNVYLDGSIGYFSDERLKTNIREIDGAEALEKLTRLQGVTYEWINKEEHNKVFRASITAQDMEAVFPEWVGEREPHDADAGILPEGEMAKTISFPTDFYAYLIEAIKEQQGQIKSLKSEVVTLRAQLSQGSKGKPGLKNDNVNP